ncbi:MAG TPA: MFS transporter [Pirellulales bacterium]|jgi:MFS family permease|nr:MFS transporter [Pirellulales bacterium]
MTRNAAPIHSALAPFQWPDFRRLFAATACATFASRALAVVLGYRVYALTNSTLALGGLGLVEAIPSISLALYGGHIADRRDRRSILRLTLAALAVCAIGLAVLEQIDAGRVQLFFLYAVVFIAGIARGFAEPAAGALEPQLVPRDLLINSSTLMATCWLIGAIIGPLAAGVAFATLGAAWTFVGIALLYLLAWLSILRIRPRPIPAAPPGESVWESVATGVRYVFGDQVLFGSMSLDLFAVLFGGVIALLPVFAHDILFVGPIGLGVLNAAPTTGALLTMLWATRHPPVKHAGRNLFLAVAAFGVTMIVFALSKSMALSVAMLFLSGVFDGVSVIIRRSIVRLLSPEHLRGRIAAVNMIFVGSSNEFGALESGVAATLLGTVPSVWAGGVVTLLIVATAAALAPKLRRLSLDPHSVIERDAQVDDAIDEDEAPAANTASEGAP